MPIRTVGDYHPSITSASKSVLLELMTILKGYRDSLVLIGGWVPYFILETHKSKDIDFTHIGSIDIDLVIDPKVIDEEKYETITRMLLSRDYKPSKEILYQFERRVKSEIDGKDYTVLVDFLTPQPPKGEGSSRRHREIQPDLKARNLPGADIALQLNQKIPLVGILPGNGETKVEFKMADLTSFLTLKGIAFGKRYQEKDAYDIYSLCDYYKEGPVSVAEELRPKKDVKIVKRGLNAIRQGFRDINAEGPSWVANFLAIADAKEKEDMKQRSFTVVNEMLKNLDI
jgi:hypothetical protein